ncbi:putative MFS family arabinose efflux permease [Gordonia hydrophobica]|nr:putative MFS family arabinose efflux permease [Gordonia hydrophobica]
MSAATSFVRPSFWGFAVFGAFWGVWGASIPRLREQAGVTDLELGVALLFVGAGALPAMLVVGRLLDRFGLWPAGPLLLALSVAGGALVSCAHLGPVALCMGMAFVGAASGAADVSLNSLAGRAEQQAGRPVITPAHATFSALVVVATLVTGALNWLGLPVLAPFGLVVAAAAAASVGIVRRTRHAPANTASAPRTAAAATASDGLVTVGLLLGIGALGALAFATENAHQSWIAVFLEDELSVPLGISAFGPAVFAAVVAVARFSVSGVGPQHSRALLLTGGFAATVGTVGIAFAPSLVVALMALAVAAAGTAVLFPTLLGIVSRTVSEDRRGRATSMLTVVAYTGFLAGPPYVGLIAGTVDLQAALLGVAALAAAMTVLVPVIIRDQTVRPNDEPVGDRG